MIIRVALFSSEKFHFLPNFAYFTLNNDKSYEYMELFSYEL